MKRIIEMAEPLVRIIKWVWLGLSTLYLLIIGVLYYAWEHFDQLSLKNQMEYVFLKTTPAESFIELFITAAVLIIICVLLFVGHHILKKKRITHTVV